MSISKFAVSKRRGQQMAAGAAEGEVPDTGRTRRLSNSIIELHSEGEVVEEVFKLWGEAQEKFLAIGRYLRRAKARFPGTFEKQIIAALPFGKNVAYQLRAVAEAVDNGRLMEDHVPRSYATAFLLISLNEVDYQEAHKRNLVRPTVTRPEVDAFRRERKALRVAQGDQGLLLLEERKALLDEMDRLQQRASLISARLEAIAAEIGPSGRPGLARRLE